jgi:hypothetical protein
MNHNTIPMASDFFNGLLEPFPISLNHILVIASEAWRSSGSDSNEPVGSPRFARDDGVLSVTLRYGATNSS